MRPNRIRGSAGLVLLLALLVLACKGEKGDKGDKGDPGVSGDPGLQGAPGSPDTPDQVLAKLNQAIAAGGTIDLQRSAVSASLTAAFDVPTDTFMKVPYSSVTYDKLGEFNSSSNRFTATRSGQYLVCAWLFASAPVTRWELDIFINGAREKGFAFASGSSYTLVGGCRPTRLDASDYLEVWTWQYSGTSQTIVPNGIWSWLTIHRID